MDPRLLGRDKRDPPVRRIRRVTMWCRGRGRRPRRPVRPMAFPCTCRASSAATSATLPYRRPGAQWTRAASVATSATLPCAVSAGLPWGAVVGAAVLGGPRVRWRFRVRAAPPSVATSATLPCPARNGPAPPSAATSATLPFPARNGPAPPSVATSATLPCAVSAGLPCGAVVGADVLGGPRVRWHLRLQAVPKVNIGRIYWNSVSRRCYSDDAVAGWSAAMRRVSSQPIGPSTSRRTM